MISDETRPPSLWRGIVGWLVGGREAEWILGDLEERFRARIEAGARPDRARAWYRRMAFASVRSIWMARARGAVRSLGREGMMWGWNETARSVRSLAKRPGFALAVVLTLGLGIGGTTAMWSVVDGVLLRPLDVESPDELVAIWNEQSGNFYNSSGPNLADLRAEVGAFEGLYAYASGQSVFEGPDGRRRQIVTARVTPDALDVLKVSPVVGAPIGGRADEGSGAWLSHALWMSEWGGDPEVVGRTISIDGGSTEVLGVLPRGLEIPALEDAEVVLPFAEGIDVRARSQLWLGAIARVRSDRTIESARLETEAVWEALRAEYPDAIRDTGIAVVPLRADMVSDVRTALLVLLGATGLLLLVACVNAGGLLFVRGRARESELAVRMALGAGRTRVTGELLREGVLLLLAAALVGTAVASFGLDALLRLAPEGLPRLDRVGLNGTALAVALTTTFLVGLGVLLLSSVGATRHARPSGMISGVRGGTPGRRAVRLRSLVVGTQAALATVLLAGAALFMRSFDSLVAVDPGYRTEGVVMARVELPAAEFSDAGARVDAFRQIEEWARDRPGVSAAGFTLISPMREGRINYQVAIDGEPAGDPQVTPVADLHIVSPAYFDALEMTPLAGRSMSDADVAAEQTTAVVSEQLADQLWPGESAVGHTIGLVAGEERLPGSWFRVVGVVPDVRFQGPTDTARGTLYLNMHQLVQYAGTLVVSAEGGAVAGLAEALRTEIPAMVAGLAEPEVFTMESAVARILAPSRFQTTLILAFACMALILAALGMYGSVAYSVALRRREIGVRLVLGADSRRVVRRVLRDGLTPALAGLAIGIGGAVLLGRSVESLLFAVGGRDPIALGAAGATLAVVAALACLVPALRSARVDPVRSLREE